MPQSVEAMEEEWESEEALESKFNGCGPGGHGSDHGLRLEVPSGVRGGKVGEAKQVEGAREDNAGDTVKTRGVPGDLRLVDGKMRGDGALESLFGEDVGSLSLRGCESINSISTCFHSIVDMAKAMLRMPSSSSLPPLDHRPRGLHPHGRRRCPSQTKLKQSH
jgi:hypothetical protein